MIKETFRYIEYSNEKYFNKNSLGKIELKKFTDDLVFAANFDSTFNALYASGATVPESIIGSPEIANFDVYGFGQHGELKGTVVYEEESFRILENEGSIKFYLRTSFNNAKGEQTFKSINPIVAPTTSNYGITIYINNVPIEITIALVPTDITSNLIYNKLSTALTGHGCSISIVNNLIKFITDGYGYEIFVTEPTTAGVLSLITLMGGIGSPSIPNGPSTDIEFLKLSNKFNNANKITLTHTTTSHIHLHMYNHSNELIVDEDLGLWSNKHTEYTAFELDWNSQTGKFFLGGKLSKVFMTGVDRGDCGTYLYLNGTGPEYHLIDELQIYNEEQNYKNYSLDTVPLTAYNSSKPYIDINYGLGFKENEVKDIIIDGTLGLSFAVKIGLSWYYYYGGDWRTSNGTFAQSTDMANFEAKFAELFFNEKFDLTIRVFFNSNGATEVSLDEISIVTEVGSVASAFITGSIRIAGNTFDLSSNSNITITTDLGSSEVDLTTSSSDTTKVTLEEIKQAIRDADVPGLASVTDDGDGKLVLIASTTGSTSYISVSEGSTTSALDLIWGSETTDTGEDDEFTGGVFVDYSELFRWIRSRLGAPLVPVELTDEQLEDCLSETIYYYNKWRNFAENVVYTNLSGSAKYGWEIPVIVGGAENIIDIILEPRYPMNYYAGRDDLMSNIFIQQIFNNNQIIQSAADYHISLIAQKDLSLILNTEVRWEIINKRLFITPLPSNSLAVAIKYKSALTLDEIVTSQQIRDLTLAIAKITLGTIRSTFGNSIPGGDGMLQLNGSELKAEGTTDRDRLIDEWKKSTQIFEFIIG